MTYLAPVAPRVPVPSSDPATAILALRLRLEMERAFGGSDADGAWDWKLAYEAGEVALVLFLRKFGRALLTRAGSPAALLPILAKVAGLLPTHTRRSEEMERFQQFSTPLPMGLAALAAAQITARDLVLEPSAGTGLLAILAEIAGGILALNELAGTRADLLRLLFPGLPVTQFDAAHIDDHLDAGLAANAPLRSFDAAFVHGAASTNLRFGRNTATSYALASIDAEEALSRNPGSVEECLIPRARILDQSIPADELDRAQEAAVWAVEAAPTVSGSLPSESPVVQLSDYVRDDVAIKNGILIELDRATSHICQLAALEALNIAFDLELGIFVLGIGRASGPLELDQQHL